MADDHLAAAKSKADAALADDELMQKVPTYTLPRPKRTRTLSHTDQPPSFRPALLISSDSRTRAHARERSNTRARIRATPSAGAGRDRKPRGAGETVMPSHCTTQRSMPG
jgi:hypothetical protein